MEALREWLRPEVIWLLVGLGLLLLEFALPGLIVFFFGLGAMVVAVLCLVMDLSLDAQLLIFVIASVVFLVSLRRWMQRAFKGYASGMTGEEGEKYQYAGERAVVRKTITAHSPGRVEFHGSDWAAEADEEIEEGVRVEIVSQTNITFHVRRL